MSAFNREPSLNKGSFSPTGRVASPPRVARAASSEETPSRPVLHREQSAQKITGAGGSAHTFSEEEKQAFSEHINFCLSSEPLLARHLPLNPDSMDLFEKCNDGLLMCKLINLAVPDAIDDRALNTNATMNVYQKTENQNLALNAAKAIGCQVINIGAQDLIEGRPILILGLVWQIIKIQLLSQITLVNFPELVLLLEEGETMQDLMRLHPELILLRWLNYHLRKGGSPRVAKNFGSDLAVSYIRMSCLCVLYVILIVFCLVISLYSTGFGNLQCGVESFGCPCVSSCQWHGSYATCKPSH